MCPDCVNACRSFSSKRGGKRGGKPIKTKLKECKHDVISLDAVENVYWASDAYDDDHNFPEGCIVCMKAFKLD